MSKEEVGLFRLVRVEDESGVSGTGHVADGVVWHDGTCTIHWRTEHTSTTVYKDFATVLAIHGHGGKTRAEFVEHPYDRGASEAAQDACENCPCASIGGLDARSAPRVPKYITEADARAWLAGYEAQCRAMYGEDWRTCGFGWLPALTLQGAAEDEKIDAVLSADEATLDAMIRAEGRDPAQVAEETRRVLEAAAESAFAKGGAA